MNYFVENNIPKDFKIGIDGLERNIPARKHSHNAAWVHLYKNMLQSAGWKNVHVLGNHDTYEGYDAMVFYPGIAYAGNINFFFGIDDNVVRRFSRIQDFQGPTFILNHEMPLIGSTIEKRIHNKSTSAKVGDLKLKILDEICKNTTRIDYVEKSTKLCFGDSHCFSTYLPGYSVCRNDGLTLFSTLRDGLKQTIEERSELLTENLTHITFYMCNIDIRHHLIRQEKPEEQIREMAIELGDQLKSLNISNIEIVHALPIENESRKLPKTGYFKGTPFYGTKEERSNLVNTFNTEVDRICIENGWSVFKWPKEFLNEEGELDFEYMERPKSVHLSPLSYRWDLFNNSLNTIHTNNGE
jgi:hypothetical protein